MTKSCNSFIAASESFKHFLFSEDLLEVHNSGSFSSVFADVAVSRGKWQYEVTLLSAGVMQIGWMKPSLMFSEGSGVGDVSRSFAYDGGRKRKWGEGLGSGPYGKLWTTGDVVGCLLDLDNKVVSFTLNGISMGEAWNEIPIGQTYSPGVRFLVCWFLVSLTVTVLLLSCFVSSQLRRVRVFESILERRPFGTRSLGILCLRFGLSQVRSG